jgi:hypothetical protein
MVHFAGNNYKCDKIISINVPLTNPALVNQITGTYFLPDIPELTNKQIVGIIGSNTIGENFLNIANLGAAWDSSYLTLYDINNIIIYDRFPLPALTNNDVQTGGVNINKIPPINNKINLRQSFISFAQGQNFAPGVVNGKTLAIGLTFFYNYK